MASETLRRRCIDQDLDYIRAYSTGMPDLVHISVTSELNWNLKVRGRHGTYWAGMVYDLEIVFSRRHPFEAPVILLPQTQRNRANRTPPSDYISGRLYLPIVKPDNWLCTTRMIDVVQAILHVFSENSFTTPTGDSIAERLPTATVEYMLGFLPIPDICRFSRTCKASLAAVHSEEFWASLYYSRCKATNTLLNVMSHPGPLRVFTTRGQWSWCDSKESFIQAHQAQLYASQNMAVERILGLEILPLGLFLTNSEQHPDYSNLSSRCDRVQHIPDARFKRKWLRYRFQRISRSLRWLISDEQTLFDFSRVDAVTALPFSLLHFLSASVTHELAGHFTAMNENCIEVMARQKVLRHKQLTQAPGRESGERSIQGLGQEQIQSPADDGNVSTAPAQDLGVLQGGGMRSVGVTQTGTRRGAAVGEQDGRLPIDFFSGTAWEESSANEDFGMVAEGFDSRWHQCDEGSYSREGHGDDEWLERTTISSVWRDVPGLHEDYARVAKVDRNGMDVDDRISSLNPTDRIRLSESHCICATSSGATKERAVDHVDEHAEQLYTERRRRRRGNEDELDWGSGSACSSGAGGGGGGAGGAGAGFSGRVNGGGGVLVGGANDEQAVGVFQHSREDDHHQYRVSSTVGPTTEPDAMKTGGGGGGGFPVRERKVQRFDVSVSVSASTSLALDATDTAHLSTPSRLDSDSMSSYSPPLGTAISCSGSSSSSSSSSSSRKFSHIQSENLHGFEQRNGELLVHSRISQAQPGGAVLVGGSRSVCKAGKPEDDASNNARTTVMPICLDQQCAVTSSGSEANHYNHLDKDRDDVIVSVTRPSRRYEHQPESRRLRIAQRTLRKENPHAFSVWRNALRISQLPRSAADLGNFCSADDPKVFPSGWSDDTDLAMDYEDENDDECVEMDSTTAAIGAAAGYSFSFEDLVGRSAAASHLPFRGAPAPAPTPNHRHRPTAPPGSAAKLGGGAGRRRSDEVRVASSSSASSPSSTLGHQLFPSRAERNPVPALSAAPDPFGFDRGLLSESTQESIARRHRGNTNRRIWGPDVYDLLEAMHEAHVSATHTFRELKSGSLVDALDYQGSWMPAEIVLSETSLGSPNKSVRALPDDLLALLQAMPTATPESTVGIEEGTVVGAVASVAAVLPHNAVATTTKKNVVSELPALYLPIRASRHQIRDTGACTSATSDLSSGGSSSLSTTAMSICHKIQFYNYVKLLEAPSDSAVGRAPTRNHNSSNSGTSGSGSSGSNVTQRFQESIAPAATTTATGSVDAGTADIGAGITGADGTGADGTDAGVDVTLIPRIPTTAQVSNVSTTLPDSISSGSLGSSNVSSRRGGEASRNVCRATGDLPRPSLWPWLSSRSIDIMSANYVFGSLHEILQKDATASRAICSELLALALLPSEGVSPWVSPDSHSRFDEDSAVAAIEATLANEVAALVQLNMQQAQQQQQKQQHHKQQQREEEKGLDSVAARVLEVMLKLSAVALTRNSDAGIRRSLTTSSVLVQNTARAIVRSRAEVNGPCTVPLQQTAPTLTLSLTDEALFIRRAWKAAFNPGIQDGPYDNFNVSQSVPMKKAAVVHFLGYEPRFDEVISRASPRLAPLRTRSRRAPNKAIEATAAIVNETKSSLGLMSFVSPPCVDSIEIRVRCLWLMSTPGAGIVRMNVPSTLTVQEIVLEYCTIMNLSLQQTTLARIDMVVAVQHALDRRFQLEDRELSASLHRSPISAAFSGVAGSGFADYSSSSRLGGGINNEQADVSTCVSPGVSIFTNGEMSLLTAGVTEGDTLDVLYIPAEAEMAVRWRSSIGTKPWSRTKPWSSSI